MKENMDTNKKIKNKTNVEINNAIIIAVVPLCFIVILNLFYVGINYNSYIIIEQQKAFVLESIIVYLICMFFMGIFGKWKKSITTVGVIILIISIINQLKYAFTGEPLLLTDVLYLGASGEIIQIVQGELWNTIKLFIIPLIIEIIIFLVLIKLCRKKAISFEIHSKKVRVTLIVIPLLLLSILFLRLKPINKFMLNYVFEVDEREDYKSITSVSGYYLTYGVIGGMYNQFLEDKIEQPEDYNENIINEQLSNTEENSEKTLGKPNIIVVFSESFWDIDQLDEIKFNQKVTPNFNMLKDKGLFFNMISPSYGGISANVEYEFLTGSNTMYFNSGYVPYMQLYKNNSYYERPSIIRELKNNGYKTKIVTCASSSLFNCGRFYKYLQVDETEYLVNVDSKYIKGQYVSDEFVTNKIINEFNNKPKDEKLFYMTLTMQAHMPYKKEKYDNYDVWVTESKFSQEVNDTLSSYAQGIFDADKQLGRLYEYIQNLEEPTIIVFYGDHLPYLYSGKDNVIDQLEYFNTDDQKINNYRKYNTQSLILANFEIKKDEEDTKYLGPDLLSSYILNNMEIKISDYYKWLYKSRKSIGAANFLVTVDSNGNIYDTYNLTGECKEVFDLRRDMEYKLFVK